jgi:hypothetical protein
MFGILCMHLHPLKGARGLATPSLAPFNTVCYVIQIMSFNMCPSLASKGISLFVGCQPAGKHLGPKVVNAEVTINIHSPYNAHCRYLAFTCLKPLLEVREEEHLNRKGTPSSNFVCKSSYSCRIKSSSN